MDFDLDTDQELFADSVRRFAREQLAPGALARGHHPDYPWEIARQIADQGLLGLTMPEAGGGQGAGLVDAVIAIQEVALSCPKSADIVQAGNFGAIRTFAEYASPDLQARFLPDLLAARTLIGLGMSEPDAGPAVTHLATTARPDGADYVIDGTKVFSTHSADATVFLIYVRYGPGTDGIGSVVVERGTPGFSQRPPWQFMSGEH